MKQSVKEWLEAIVCAVVLFLVLFLFCFPTQIQGPSMANTLHNGDRVMISRFLAKTGRIDREDIVVFHTSARGKQEDFVKRVIGLPGDHVVVEDGQVSVNGEPLSEAYANGETYGSVDLTVPEKTIFVMGDNREVSMDSREIGVVPMGTIQSVVLFRWYPLNQIKRL